MAQLHSGEWNFLIYTDSCQMRSMVLESLPTNFLGILVHFLGKCREIFQHHGANGLQLGHFKYGCFSMIFWMVIWIYCIFWGQVETINRIISNDIAGQAKIYFRIHLRTWCLSKSMRKLCLMVCQRLYMARVCAWSRHVDPGKPSAQRNLRSWFGLPYRRSRQAAVENPRICLLIAAVATATLCKMRTNRSEGNRWS